MGYLGVQDRFQIQMSSMEEFIDKENTVSLWMLLWSNWHMKNYVFIPKTQK
jgi:hypothetical protein